MGSCVTRHALDAVRVITQWPAALVDRLGELIDVHNESTVLPSPTVRQGCTHFDNQS